MGGDVLEVSEPSRIPGEAEGARRLALHVIEGISAAETSGDRKKSAVGRVSDVARVEARLEGALEDLAARAEMACPGNHAHADHHPDARPEAVQPALLDQIDAELSEAETFLVPSETRPQDRPSQERISDRRGVGVPALETETRHVKDCEDEQIRVHRIGHAENTGEHVHGRSTLEIAHPRQIQECLDRSISDLVPQALVLAPHFLVRRLERPFDSDLAHVVQASLHRAVEAFRHPEEIGLNADDTGQVDPVSRAARQHREPGFRGLACAAHVLALRASELDGEDQLVAALPGVFGKQRGTAGEIAEGRRVGGRRPGALARDQVQPGDLPTLLRRHEQRGAAIELVDDVEDCLVALLRGYASDEGAAEGEMGACAVALRDESVASLLNPIVQERIGAALVDDEPPGNGLRESCTDGRLRNRPTPDEPRRASTSARCFPGRRGPARHRTWWARGGRACRP